MKVTVHKFCLHSIYGARRLPVTPVRLCQSKNDEKSNTSNKQATGIGMQDFRLGGFLPQKPKDGEEGDGTKCWDDGSVHSTAMNSPKKIDAKGIFFIHNHGAS